MKKAFISVYVLLILLALSLTISFIYRENEGNFENSQDLYNKKVSMFEAESLLNIIIGEIDGNEDEWIGKEDGQIKIDKLDQLEASFYSKSSFRIDITSDQKKVKEAEDASGLSIRAYYKDTISYAIMAYKLDENKNLKIIYKKVY